MKSNDKKEDEVEGGDDYINPDGVGLFSNLLVELITLVLRLCDTGSLLKISTSDFIKQYLPVIMNNLARY